MKSPGTKKIVHRRKAIKKNIELSQATLAEKNNKISSDKKEKLTQTSWGNVSSWYEGIVENEDSYQAKVIAPNLVRILGELKSKNVLDLACGEGYFTRLLSSKGAECTGADISKELISLAKEKDKKSKYIVSPSDELGELAPNSFDFVVCVLALQNIEKIRETLIAIQRVLKKDGQFVFVLNHPSFRNPKQADWHYDNDRKGQGRVVYEYMTQSKIKIDMTPGQLNTRKKEYTVSFHRPLQFFVKELIKNGFVINGMEEWISHKESEKGPRREAENKARHEIPMFMSVSARKS